MKMEITLDKNEETIILHLKPHEKYMTQRAIFENIQNLVIAVWIKGALVGEFRKDHTVSEKPIVLVENAWK